MTGSGVGGGREHKSRILLTQPPLVRGIAERVNMLVRRTVPAGGGVVREPVPKGSASFAPAFGVRAPPLQWAEGAASRTVLLFTVLRVPQPWSSASRSQVHSCSTVIVVGVAGERGGGSGHGSRAGGP